MKTENDTGMNAYQKEAHAFAKYDCMEIYPFAGLAEETGEVLGKYAKFVRKYGLTPFEAALEPVMLQVVEEFFDAVKKELGDVLWMLQETAGVCGFDLADIANDNIAKLADRAKRGVIVGEGDNR